MGLLSIPYALAALRTVCNMAEDGGGEKARLGVVEHYRLESELCRGPLPTR